MYNAEASNAAELIGRISSAFLPSHEVYNEKFYSFTLTVPRLSGAADELVITVSDDLLYGTDYRLGDCLCVKGQFRSYNNYSEVGNKLILTVFAKQLEYIPEVPKEGWINEILLRGYLCKPPIYRTTPFGREITDLLVATNRTYNKSDYIPCIAWGRNSKFASGLSVGDKVEITGRMQSREYQKKIGENQVDTRVAYEVSVTNISS